MSDIEEVKRLLKEAGELMYEDMPPGRNEIEAYQKITKALSLLEEKCPCCGARKKDLAWLQAAHPGPAEHVCSPSCAHDEVPHPMDADRPGFDDPRE